MGSAVDYSCPGCGYHVDGMVSGYDVGMASHVAAVSCADCRALYVTPVPGRPWDADARDAASTVEQGRVPAGVRCPRSARHRVTLWTAPGACPRCGARLQAGEHWITSLTEEMRLANERMGQEQLGIERLKGETRQIARETRQIAAETQQILAQLEAIF